MRICDLYLGGDILITWEQKAIMACKEKGLDVVGFEGGWVFVKDKNETIYPLLEETVAKWINA